MQKLTRLLTSVFLLLVFVSGIAFSYWNTTSVSLSFGWWVSPEQPVAVWIIAAFAIGGLIGVLAGTGIARYFRHVRELKRLQRQLQDSKIEVARLRNASAKGQ